MGFKAQYHEYGTKKKRMGHSCKNKLMIMATAIAATMNPNISRESSDRVMYATGIEPKTATMMRNSSIWLVYNNLLTNTTKRNE